MALRSAGLMTTRHQRQVKFVRRELQQYSLPLPSVSVPSENGTTFAATAAALPELLPSGLTVKLYGLRAWSPRGEKPSL